MPTKEQKRELDGLATIIEAIDGYRVGRNMDPRRFSQKLDELDQLVRRAIGRVGRQRLEKVVDFVVNLPARDPSAARWSSIFMVVRFLLRVTMVLFMLSLGLWVYGVPWAPHVTAAATALVYVVFVVRWYSLVKLEEFYERAMRDQPGKEKVLKRSANSFIRLLAAKIEEYGSKPSKHKLHLFKVDYDGIRVLKRPSLIRETYLAEVVASEAVGGS